VLGFIKGFIEKNTWIGLEEFYDSLSQALIQEYNIPPAKAKRRIRKSAAGQVLPNLQTSLPIKPIIKDEAQFCVKSPSNQVYKIKKVETVTSGSKAVKRGQPTKFSWIVIFLLITLISLNVILFVKLWRLEDFQDTNEILR
jgi:hypothetical protein